MIVVIIVVYVICWLPSQVTGFIQIMVGPIHFETPYIMYAFDLICRASFACNPVIYVCMDTG
jgi:hypothetical protein